MGARFPRAGARGASGTATPLGGGKSPGTPHSRLHSSLGLLHGAWNIFPSVFPIEMNFLPNGKKIIPHFLAKEKTLDPSGLTQGQSRSGCTPACSCPCRDFSLGFYRFLIQLLSVRRQQAPDPHKSVLHSQGLEWIALFSEASDAGGCASRKASARRGS